MRVRGLLACLALAAMAMAPAWAAEPGVRVEIQASQPVLVGQQVRIDVTVVAPNFFTSAPPFPPLQVAGAIVTMPDERGLNGVEQSGGETLATIQKSYVFAAQQAGEFVLPPVKIEFSYGGGDGKPRSASLSLPPTRITARLPEGAKAGDTVLPVARLTIRQSFDRSTEGLKAGDALVRSIEVFAAQTQAMMIPPPHFEAPDGVRVFVADPVLSDQNPSGGGFAGGRRIDRATYVFERAGRYTLPAIELRWFDPATRKPATAQAPALTVRVAAGPHGAQGIAPDAPVAGVGAAARWRLDWPYLVGALMAVAVLAGGAWWARTRWPRWQARLQARRDARAASDACMFDQVLAASQRADPQGTHAALLAWCAAHARSTPRAWAAQLQGDGLRGQIEALERQLYGAGPPSGAAWSGPAFAAALRTAHRQWQADQRAATGPRRHAHALGPLNPFLKRKT